MVSIIIPVYDVEEYLDLCVESVIAQTYRDLEIILVDDGSIDKSPQLCDEWAQKDSRIRVVHKANGGLSDARNVGLDVSTGDYVYFLDSDDFIEPTAIQNLYSAILSGNYAIAISYFVSFVDGKKRYYRKDWFFSENRIIESSDFADRMLTEKSNFAATAKLYKRDVVQNVRFRLNKRNEDTLFIVDLIPVVEANDYRCIDIPDYSYIYRMRAGSISHNQKLPLSISVIENYNEAITVCQGKQQTIDWLRNKQFSLAFELSFILLKDKELTNKYYFENCSFLSGFSNNLIKHRFSVREYWRFLALKYFPFTYKVFYRLRDYARHLI